MVKKTFIFLLLLLCIIGVFFYWYKVSVEIPKNPALVIAPIIVEPEVPKNTVSVLNFGDVMFDRGVRNIMEKYGRDPFEYVKKNGSFMKNFDVVIANLEGPIIEMSRKDCQQKIYNFQFASTTPDLLKSVGIYTVNIANNHSYDCYSRGFASTKKYLTEAGIEYMGDRNVEKSFVVKTIKGKKVAFVGMDQTVAPIPISDFYPLVKKLKSENDYVVVDIHWGTEYELTETPVQEEIAHNLIDNGVDVIFGHHPHVIEPVAVYKNKVIFYSLGNFVFDQSGEHETQGIGAGALFGETENIFVIYPFRIESFAPHFLTGDDQKTFCDSYLQSLVHTGCSFRIVL